MGSLVLTVFSVSMLIFQFSCKKDANAQSTSAGLTQQNLIVFHKWIYSGTSSSSTSTGEIWTSNIDGTNQKKIPITLPSGVFISGDVKLTPDCKTVVFETYIPYTNYDVNSIYTCSIDGTNLKKIITGSNTDMYNYQKIYIDGAY